MKKAESGFAAGRGSRSRSACGALCVFLGELQEKKINVSIDDEDAEQTHLKMRLLKEIPYGDVLQNYFMNSQDCPEGDTFGS